MSIKNTIKDGTGSNLEARVLEAVTTKENALCVNISGSTSGAFIQTTSLATGGQAELLLSLNGDGVNFNANSDGTLASPVVFTLPGQTQDLIISEISIIIADGSIKLNNWAGTNGAITNGCLLILKANNLETTFSALKKTTDIAAFSSKGGFDLYSEAAGDMVRGVREFAPHFILRAKDTFGSSASQQDHITWYIRDYQTGITEVRIQVRGFFAVPGVY